MAVYPTCKSFTSYTTDDSGKATLVNMLIFGFLCFHMLTFLPVAYIAVLFVKKLHKVNIQCFIQMEIVNYGGLYLAQV